MHWFWLFLGIFLVIGELLTVDFLLLWFACGAFGAAFVALFYTFVYQLLVFVLVAIILTVCSRKVIKRRPGTKTNIEALIGEEALVVETVQKVYCDRGLVRVHGETWRAYCEEQSIPVGMTVKIIEVNGTKLRVIPLGRP